MIDIDLSQTTEYSEMWLLPEKWYIEDGTPNLSTETKLRVREGIQKALQLKCSKVIIAGNKLPNEPQVYDNNGKATTLARECKKYANFIFGESSNYFVTPHDHPFSEDTVGNIVELMARRMRMFINPIV